MKGLIVGCRNCNWQETLKGNPASLNKKAKKFQVKHRCNQENTFQKEVENKK